MFFQGAFDFTVKTSRNIARKSKNNEILNFSKNLFSIFFWHRRPSRPIDFHRRVQAVHAFALRPEAQSLAAANKRVANILSKQYSPAVQPALSESLLQESAEKALYAAIIDKESEVVPYVKQGDYQKGLTLLAELKPAIDGFFDEVLVMAENEAVRDNRLALLAKLQLLFLNLADISYLSKS